MRDACIKSLDLQVEHSWDQLLQNNSFDASIAFHIIYFPHWSQKIPDALNSNFFFVCFIWGLYVLYNCMCQILCKDIQGMCRTVRN